MATCKECVHVEVCRYYTNELAKANGIPLKLEEVERLLECDDCENFKDRSRFVELTCKAGDTIYTVSLKYGILPWSVFGICSAIDEWSATPRITLLACSTKLGRNAKFSAKMLNASVFLTHEEAEQALKERENNG